MLAAAGSSQSCPHAVTSLSQADCCTSWRVSVHQPGRRKKEEGTLLANIPYISLAYAVTADGPVCLGVGLPGHVITPDSSPGAALDQSITDMMQRINRPTPVPLGWGRRVDNSRTLALHYLPESPGVKLQFYPLAS